MVGSFSRRAVLAGGAALLATPGYAARERDSRMVSALDAHARALARHDDFSGALLFAKNNDVLYKEAFGLADRQEKRPNNIDTKFNLASLSKMFTAVVVLQLIEAGRISFNDVIERHLPDYPNKSAARTVTIAHLLTHTSGVGNYWDGLAQLGDDFPDSHPGYLPLFAEKPLAITPGEEFSYSNGGYIVLGLIIEAVTERNFFDYIEARIFSPLGMKNTGYFPVDEDIHNTAIGYTRSLETPGDWDDQRATWERRGSAAGGAYSTVSDLFSFAKAVLQNRLLSKEMTQAFLLGRVDFYQGRYGYGVIEQSINGKRLVGHSGGHHGVACELMMFPEEEAVFIVLSNCDVDAYWNIEMLVKKLIAGPTEETKNYTFTETLIATTIASGFEAGMSEYQSQLEHRSPRKGVINLAAFKYLHRSDFDAAYDLLKLNRKIFPDSADAIFSMAEGLRVMGRLEAALENYQKFLELEPDSAEVRRQIQTLESRL